MPLERCSSGLRGTPGKRVVAKSGTGVRIPLSPQSGCKSIRFFRSCQYGRNSIPTWPQRQELALTSKGHGRDAAGAQRQKKADAPSALQGPPRQAEREKTRPARLIPNQNMCSIAIIPTWPQRQELALTSKGHGRDTTGAQRQKKADAPSALQEPPRQAEREKTRPARLIPCITDNQKKGYPISFWPPPVYLKPDPYPKMHLLFLSSSPCPDKRTLTRACL